MRTTSTAMMILTLRKERIRLMAFLLLITWERPTMGAELRTVRERV
jgi:hypothetical protein